MSFEHSQYNAPPPLRVEEVPNGLICSICFGIPMKPKITPCEHVFCDGCAENALAATEACPNCRRRCERNQLRPMPRGTFMHRAWSTVMVKCLWHEKGCVWTGSIVDTPNHIGSCVHGQDNDINPRIELIQCEEHITMLKQRTSDLESVVSELESVVLELDRQGEEQSTMLKQRNLDLERKVRKLESKVLMSERKVNKFSRDRRMKLPVLFDDDYEFGRHDVVDLSQLISRYLEYKPDFIDPNRIFICVRNCYTDLGKSYKDNPENYNDDMRMLLSTCYATVGWFTNKQHNHILDWLVKQGWN